MKNIVKNLKVNRKILEGFLLAAGTFVLVISLKKETKIVPVDVSLEQVLDENKDNTNLDEVLDLNENISDKIREISDNLEIIVPIGAETVKEEYLLDCVTRLELYINLSNRINKLSFQNKNSLKDVDENMRNQLFENKDNEVFVNDLIKTFNNKDTTDIEKARCMQKLNYLDSYYKKYVTENGLAITEDLITKLLKSFACSVSGLEPENYDSCQIVTYGLFRAHDYIIVTDPVSGAKYNYNIMNESDIIKEISQNLENVKFVQNDGDYDYDKVYNYCVSALNNTKLLLKTGVKLEGNRLVLDNVNTNEKKDVKVKLKTKQ